MAIAGPRRLHDLLDAVVTIGSNLDLEETLQRITILAKDLVGARYGALGVLDESGERLVDFITAGVDAELRSAIGDPPKGHGILGLLIATGEPMRLPDLGRHPDSHGFPPHHPDMHSFLGVPIRVRDHVFGNLYITEKAGGGEFTDIDEELLVGLAAAAGVAIENARLHATVADLTLSRERERIARDLHDTVVQRLFATGLQLQATIPLVAADPSSAVERIESAVDALDGTVRKIRSTIFALESRHRSHHGLTDQILGTCRAAAEMLGFEPRVVLEGPLDIAVDGGPLASDLLGTLEEALSNVAQHADATEVTVALIAEEGEVVLTVVDDGVGPPPDIEHTGHGLRNMAGRAERHGGELRLAPTSNRGTTLTWWVPATDREAPAP